MLFVTMQASGQVECNLKGKDGWKNVVLTTDTVIPDFLVLKPGGRAGISPRIKQKERDKSIDINSFASLTESEIVFIKHKAKRSGFCYVVLEINKKNWRYNETTKNM